MTRPALLLIVAGLLGCTRTVAVYTPGYLPAQDNCTAGVSFTYNSDKTWSLTSSSECTKFREFKR